MPDENELSYLQQETDNLLSLLHEEISRQKIEAEPFVGGSFVKETIIKKNKYDVDIFLRFDWRFEDLSKILESLVKKVSSKGNFKVHKLHGSRDYFQLQQKGGILFELVPVYKIKKPEEARNVTDLSYFHVNYIKKKFAGNELKKEVLLAKQFAMAQKVYGAESHINGFSGYGLECLIIYYESFLSMLKKLSKINERIVIDPEKHYKNSTDALLSLNESKLNSPVVLVDPTFKERNVLAALSRETFRHFQESAKEFLKKPSGVFFEIQESDINKFKELASSKKGEFINLQLSTDRQEGDIAGTKMKKFSIFLEKELHHFFDVLSSEYIYSGERESELYLILKPKKKITIIGPPIEMKVHAEAFKKRHKNALVKAGHLQAEFNINFSAKQFLNDFKKKNDSKLKEMGITGFKVI